MKILVSGFEPFDGMSSNPSQQLVESLENVESIILPVRFDNCFSLLKKKINECHPHFVICTGLANIRDEITPERIAINLIEARIPDNIGKQPIGEKVIPEGPDGLFSTLPIKNMVKACQQAGIKSTISNSAGTYICNFLMYHIINYGNQKGFKAGFVHIPPIDKMSFQNISRGFQQMLAALSQEESKNLNFGNEC